jgi:1-acyl-sn-glycerol-3-phosphate acyltransferase
MFNFIATGAALIKVNGEIKKYMRRSDEIDRLFEAGEHEKVQQIIREGEDTFCDNVTRKLGINISVEGAENIPDESPVLIMSNHQGYTDVLAVLYAIRNFQIGYIAKSEFKKLKSLTEGIRYTGSLFIDRGDPRAAIKTINKAAEMFASGYSFCIFPEGTRSHGPEIGEFKAGSFKFAQKGKVPILPVTCIDTYKVFEEYNSFHKADCRVVIHPLVHYEQLDRKQQVEAQHEIYETIKSAL